MDDVLAPTWVFSSLMDRIVGDADLSLFNSFMASVGLDLSVLGEYTLLAPTNNGVNALGDDVFSVLSNPDNTDLLIQVLVYHIFPGVITSDQLKPGRIDSFQGNFVKVEANPIRFNGAGVAEADILANNGVMHKINSLLIFTDGVRGNTIIDFLADNPNTSSFYGALQRSGFDAALSQAGSLTVLAPTDEVFESLPRALTQLLFFNDQFFPHLQNFLLYNLIAAEISSSSFVNATLLTALNGEQIAVRTDPLAFNGASVASSDNQVDNGIVHTISGALAPSWVFNTLASRIVAAADLSVLGALLVLSEVNLSSVGGAVTVLAPTNTAFFALGDDALNALAEDPVARGTLLGYHLLAGVFTTFQLSSVYDDVAPMLELPNVLGTTVNVTSAVPLTFENAGIPLENGVVQADWLASNGVLHKIDTVLDPTSS